MGKGKDKDGICMADGGITRQETADELMARMTAKYGAPAAGPAPQQPAPVAQTQPQPKSAPTQPASSGQGILGILRGRKEAIDKATNFADGGIPAGAPKRFKFEGEGGPREDKVPVKVAGQKINVSDGEQALIVPAKTAANARAMKAIQDIIAGSNDGRQPDMGDNAGPNFRDGGMTDEEALKMNYQAVTGIAAPSPVPAPAANMQAADSMSLGKSPAPTIYGNGGLSADVVQRGIETMRGQLAKPQSPAPAATGPAAVTAPQPAKVADTSFGQTVDDGSGGVYTPGGGAIAPDKEGSGILNGIVNFFKDSAQAARGEKSYEQIRAERAAGQASPTTAQTPSLNDGKAAVKVDPFGAKPDQFSSPSNSDGTFMTGKDGARPDSSGGGFVQKNVSYNVNPTSQEGITKITSSKTNPLYTNGRPEDAVAGLNNQSVGAQDVQEGLNRHARANAITQSLIDKQPAGGVGILGDGGVSASNDEKTARWRQDELLQQAKYGNRAAGDAIQANAKLAGDQIHSITSQRGQDITARGHDVHAQTEADRLAGNPVDNQLKKAQTRGILAQSASTEALAGLQERAIAGDANAAATLRALTGNGQASDRYLTVPGGEEIGPDGMTKIKKPSGVFDAQTQKFVSMDGGSPGQAQAPAAAVDFLKKNPNQAAAFKAKYGYLPEGF